MPGSGAAGGIGVPLLATGAARIGSGADVMMELAGFSELSRDASLVVVGEGCLDSQSLRGKGPVAVARRAKEDGATVVAVVGRNQLTAAQVEASPIDRVYALTDVQPDLDACLANPRPVLQVLAARLAAAEVERGRQR